MEKKKKSSPYQPYSQLLGNHFYGICRPLWKNRLPKASICQYFTKFRFSLLFLVLNCGHTCPQTNVNRKGPGKPHKLSKWPWGISSSGMLSLPTRKGILEDKFKLVLWKPINLQHLLDMCLLQLWPVFHLFQPLSNQQTLLHSCRCNGFWTPLGLKTKAGLVCSIWVGHSRCMMLHYQSLCCSQEKHGHQFNMGRPWK